MKEWWIKRLPLDVPETMARMMAGLHPRKSLEEVQLETGIALDQLYKLAAHLVAWGRQDSFPSVIDER